MEYDKKALELYNSGYNCAQAVVCAFCGAKNIDFDTVMKIAAPFGRGITAGRELCGAVSGMCMAVGMMCAGQCGDPIAQANVICVTHALVEKFRQQFHSITCRELLERQSESCTVQCTEFIEYAARILAEQLKKHDDMKKI